MQFSSQSDHKASPNCHLAAHWPPSSFVEVTLIVQTTKTETNMPPLALIPVGLYALIATVSAENAIDNVAKHSLNPEQKLTLKEIAAPSLVMDGARPLQSSTPAFAPSSGISDPVVKTAIANALQLQAGQKRQQFVENKNASELSTGGIDNPGRYFPKTYLDDDGGYSAPLGLKDDSHNDWMK